MTDPAHKLSAAEKAFLRGHRLARINGDEPCLGLVELFFPDRAAPGWRGKVATAIRMCDEDCRPMRRLECQVGAMRRHEVEGIWGGIDFFDLNNVSSARNKRKRRERAAQREAS